MAGYKDKNGKFITEPGRLKFTYPDECEPTGFGEYIVDVKIKNGQLGYYSTNEKRVILFREKYQDTHQLNDAEIV